jgi:hypothetical protein
MRQEALYEAHKKESKIFREAGRLNAFLNSGRSELKRSGGDDVKDGLKAQRTDHVEDNEPEVPPAPKLRKKLEIVKMTNERKKGLQKHKDQMRRHVARLKGKINIGQIAQDLAKPSKKSLYQARKAERDADKRVMPNHIRGAEDVLLTSEVPDNFRTLENHSTSVWMETIRSLKDSDLFMKKDRNKLKNYYQNGVPVRVKI